MNSKLESLLKSRRFWASAVGLVATIFSETLGIELSPEVKAQVVAALIGVFVVGDSIRRTE